MSRILHVFLVLTLLSSSYMLDSCIFFSGNTQQVTMIIPTEQAKLKVDNTSVAKDSTYTGAGSKFNPTLINDAFFKQVRFDADGFKTGYYFVFSDGGFEDSYTFPPLVKIRLRDTLMKRLAVSDVDFEDNISFKAYWHGGSQSRFPPDLPVSRAELHDLKSSNLTGEMNRVLKKMNYVDTVNRVFIDEVNTLYLDAMVTKVDFKIYNRMTIWNNDGFFVDATITAIWTLKNAYGDTLYKDTSLAISGKFCGFTQLDIPFGKIAGDALESSMQEFIDSAYANNFLKLESTNITFADQIKIEKPSKHPTTLEEGLKTTVTVKTKDSHGSGFLISQDGYIITNHHVVSHKNSDYTILMNDGKEYKAKVVRSNTAIDLALLKIDGQFDMAFNLPSKQNFNVGDEALAIGTPRSIQLGQSASKGIVSGFRKNKGMNFLQTDISVNGGNSGGPIVLKNGELIGVVQYKLVGLGSEGVSFSIPAFDIMQNLNLQY